MSNVSNIALLVVFNHRYDANLPRLRKLYNNFENVYFLVPFYDGLDKDVIPVYESSDNFSGYFAQAWQHLKNIKVDYWFVVADDMVINPRINPDTLAFNLRISPKDSYIPELHRFNKTTQWIHAHKSLSFTFNNPYLQIVNELPDKEKAEQIMKRHNLLSQGLSFHKVYNEHYVCDPYHQYNYRYFNDKKNSDSNLPIQSEYPFVFGYSDIFCIGSVNMERFCHYCGVFAAAGLFVEIAIPTSILLATKGKTVTQNDISLKGLALWGHDAYTEMENRYDLSLSKLIAEFPRKQLFMHPVKLSRWKD
jgi:hypothetical protein